MRGPSNERKMPNNVAVGGEYRVGGYARASPSENLACILGTRFKPGQEPRPGLSETKERSRRGPRGGGGYVGFTRGFRLLPDRKKQAG